MLVKDESTITVTFIVHSMVFISAVCVNSLQWSEAQLETCILLGQFPVRSISDQVQTLNLYLSLLIKRDVFAVPKMEVSDSSGSC
jgi:hypothetical protein